MALLLSGAEPGLAAATNHNRSDQDGDGLSDVQELVIDTLPYRSDSDADGYSDLEECARESDPRVFTSVPEDAPYGLGTCASQSNGFVTVVLAVYLRNAPLDTLRLELGVVHRGKVLRFLPQDFQYSRGFLRAARDPRDTLAVVEVGLPQSLVARLGHMNLFAILSGRGPAAADPIVGLVSLTDFSGVVMSIERTRAGLSTSGGGGTGVVYRPLAGDDQIPAQWSSGEICFQRAAAVGMRGVSIVHEVDAADCLPLDTYCSPSDCASGVGSSLELPDPAALVGG